MLSRSAQGLYWIGRYLERAEHLCRLLAERLDALEDRPVEEIDRGWRRIYAALGRAPTGGDLAPSGGAERVMLADAYTLADDLTFEPANPDSVRACLAAARENARQVRNVIGRDMWACLNVAYLGLRGAAIAEIWRDRPVEFYRRLEGAVRTFSGIAESAMYRDEGWHFLQLGRFVERVQLVAALLEAQLAASPPGEPPAESDWRSVLEVCEARVAYNRRHALEYRPSAVVDFLVADPALAHSIRYALARIAEALDAVSGRRPLAIEAGRRAGRMAARIDFDWPDRDPADDGAARSALREIRESCRRLHDDAAAAYFDYEIEDRPRP